MIYVIITLLALVYITLQIVLGYFNDKAKSLKKLLIESAIVFFLFVIGIIFAHYVNHIFSEEKPQEPAQRPVQSSKPIVEKIEPISVYGRVNFPENDAIIKAYLEKRLYSDVTKAPKDNIILKVGIVSSRRNKHNANELVPYASVQHFSTVTYRLFSVDNRKNIYIASIDGESDPLFLDSSGNDSARQIELESLKNTVDQLLRDPIFIKKLYK